MTRKEFFEKEFPHLTQKAKKEVEKYRNDYEKVKKEIESIDVPLIQDVINSIFTTDYEIIFVLQNIGESCYKYLVSVDIVLNKLLFNEELMDSE